MTSAQHPSYFRKGKEPPLDIIFDANVVSQFHQTLPSYAPTSLQPLNTLAQELGVKSIHLKLETSRFTLPSFKILGASWATYRALLDVLDIPLGKTPTAAAPDLDIVARAAQQAGIRLFAATDGNHGRAVARMARMIGIEAVIFVPRSVDDFTKGCIRGESAIVHTFQGHYDGAIGAAANAADADPTGVLIQDHAFEGYEKIPGWITEGYTTMFREIDERLAELGERPTVIVTPVGVGSLGQAVVMWYKTKGETVRIVAVEPETAACLYESLNSGLSTSIETAGTIMNGLDCGTVSLTAWPLLRDHVDAAVTISDIQSHRAVQWLSSQGIDSGPCGAAGVAAIRNGKLDTDQAPFLTESDVVVLLCTEGKRPYTSPAGG